MFETVAAPRPVDPGRRLGSLALSLLLNGSLLGALLLLGQRLTVQVVEEWPDEPLTIVELADPPPPGPVELPPAPTARGGTPVVAPAPPVEPPPAPPPEPVNNPPTDLSAIALSGPPYEGDPVRGGDGVGGEGGGEGEGEVHTGPYRVASSDLRPRYKIDPPFPNAAIRMGIEEGRCEVHLTIDERGLPTDVAANCTPSAFQASLLEDAWKWRFYPKKIAGEPVAVSVTYVVRYRLR